MQSTSNILNPSLGTGTPNYGTVAGINGKPLGAQPNSQPTTSGYIPLPSNTTLPVGVTGSSNGFTPGATALPTSNQNSSIYQQNLSRYGLTSIPTGYAFNAQGVLQNGAGQEYQATPSSGGATSGGSTGTTQGTITPHTTGINSPTPSSTYPGIVGTLATTASQPSSQFTTAENDYNAEKQQLGNLQTQAAQAQGSIQNTPGISLQAATGQSGQVQNLLANEEAPISSEMTASQAAAQNATTQQGTQQSGLSSAGALAAPQAANQFGTYNPQTLGYTGYGGGTTGSGAASAGAVGTQVSQGAAVQQATGILAQAQGLSSTLSNAINQTGYNPANSGNSSIATNLVNGVNQWLQTQSGSPQYQNIANLISEVSSKYAAILQQSGGTPTSVSQVQQQIINGLAGGQQIETILGNLATNAQTSINTLNTASKSNATNGTTGNNSGTIFHTTL